MDYAAVATDLRTGGVDLDRRRLDAFRLGSSIPSSSSAGQRAHPKPSHSRSHSRHTSVSAPLPPLSLSLSLTSMATNSPPSSPPPLPSTSNAKRNSHHRRRSSVSTRHESAEIMGFSLPAISSSKEDNINLGDKDSIRRRALLALEGKTDVGSFSKVEIPELTTPDIEKRFDFPTKPSYPPGIGAGYSGGLSSLASNKRDSFGKFIPMASSKEQLGTLVEEEEDEEVLEKAKDDITVVSCPNPEALGTPVEAAAPVSSSAPVRHRPATLNLRPLSLTSNLIPVAASVTPSLAPAPSPRPRPGLRSLTLSPSLGSESAGPLSGNAASVTTSKRQSLILSGSPSFPASVPTRGPSLNGTTDSAVPTASSQLVRRSSISYFNSGDAVSMGIHGLPTPEMTPTSDRRYSQDSVSSDHSRSSHGSRTLSTNDHAFLYQAHAALVQRISDLERALSARPRSRPQSTASEASSINEPTDEMLSLIADLKAERDELKRDVEGWRVRVVDYERQVTLLMKRLENERRDAWVARERVNMVEFEKKAIETTLVEKISWGEDGWRELKAVQGALSTTEQECQRLRRQVMRVTELEAETRRLSTALVEERRKREEAEKELESLLSTPTPQAFELSQYRTPPMSRTMIFAKRSGLGFRSMDSSGSSTDVESLDGSCDRHQVSLKVVHEEEEDDSQDARCSDCTDPEDDLARYEDEDETDHYAFHASLSDSSFGSDSDDSPDMLQPTDVSSDGDPLPELSSARSASSSPAPSSPPQVHERHASMIKAWTFPQGGSPASQIIRDTEEIDRFFGCLEDVDNSPPLATKLHSAESEKNLFAQALAEADDDFPPFMIPSHVGTEVALPETKSTLHVVIEEDEGDSTFDDVDDHEFIGQEDEGGIVFTFTPPPISGQLCADAQLDIPVSVAGTTPGELISQSELSVAQEQPSLTSSVPRPAPSRSFTSNIPTPSSSTPVKSGLPRVPKASDSTSAFTTPVKRGVSPSSIPRLPFSSSPSPSTSKPRTTSFIPQPRKSAPSAQPNLMSTPTKSQSKPRSSMLSYSDAQPSSSRAEVRTTMTDNSSILPDPDNVSSSPFVSPTFAAIQSLTSLIPSLPWTSPKTGKRASSVSCTIPSSSSTSTVASSGSTVSVASSSAGQPSVPMVSLTGGYVPRARQLAKLKARMEQEAKLQPTSLLSGHGSLQRRYRSGIIDL